MQVNDYSGEAPYSEIGLYDKKQDIKYSSK